MSVVRCSSREISSTLDDDDDAGTSSDSSMPDDDERSPNSFFTFERIKIRSLTRTHEGSTKSKTFVEFNFNACANVAHAP